MPRVRTARDAGADVAIVDHGPLEGFVFCVAACRQRPFYALPKVRPFSGGRRSSGLSSVQADLSAIVKRMDHVAREFADHRIQEVVGLAP